MRRTAYAQIKAMLVERIEELERTSANIQLEITDQSASQSLSGLTTKS